MAEADGGNGRDALAALDSALRTGALSRTQYKKASWKLRQEGERRATVDPTVELRKRLEASLRAGAAKRSAPGVLPATSACAALRALKDAGVLEAELAGAAKRTLRALSGSLHPAISTPEAGCHCRGG